MSTRPSHDNVINTLGVNMASALDQIMTVQEESYDDFLEGFTYLNKDELRREMIIPTKKKTEKPQTNKSKGTEDKGPCLEKTQIEKVDKIEISQEDELEEETLEEGEKTSIMSQKTQTGSDVTSRLKFDNFVMTEEADDDESNEICDDFMLDGYEASFCLISKKELLSKESDCNNKRTPDQDEADIDSLLQDNSGESKVLDIPVHFENRDLHIRNVELDQIPSNQAPSLIDSDHSQCDIDLQRECAPCSEQLSCSDRFGAPPLDTVLNPGEVEDQESPRRIMNKDQERILDFSATYRTEVVLTSESTEECSNEVTAFCLDENFDYDNVVLTPKFTVEEVAFLKSCKT